jgi:hypothetical protein
MKSRRNKNKDDGSMRKLFLQQLINTIKDSEFMDGVMDELIVLYSENTDEQNELDFDETMLPDMLDVCVQKEWYEIAARLHKQITKLQTNVEAG